MKTVEDFTYKMLFAIVFGLFCWCNLTQAQAINSTGTNLSSKPCASIDIALNAQGDSCQCYETVERDRIDEDEYEEINESRLYPWIGCTRERMPSIYRSLNALQNNTILDKLWIWDSLIPLVPAKFFAKIRVHKLILENDHLGEFASGAVAPLARHLRQLIVKNNIIKEINAEMFENLHRLRLLDLSGNMIGELNERSFGDHMKNLHTLSLYDNKIHSLVVGTFEKMKNLRKLNIAANRLTSLDGSIFRNLHKLEYLSLENNQLTYINSNVLIDLMNLKVLNLGGNFLNSLTIPMSMASLSQLYLNNNSFFTVSHLNIEASTFSNLQMLNLDKNHLVSLENEQFSKFVGLQVLSVTSNELTSLREHCLRNLHNLTVLSLQNNRIDDLSLSSEVLFSNSLRLEKLYLSTNSLTRIESKPFGKLSELKVLSLAHNQIHTIDADTLVGLTSLEKLYLNDNFLKNLHNSTFDPVPSSLYAVDLSDNPWHCDCQSLWLTKWVLDHSDMMVDLDNTVCNYEPLVDMVEPLERTCHRRRPMDADQFVVEQLLNKNGLTGNTGFWITALGVILGVVSLMITVSIILLYLQDGRLTGLKERRSNFMKRVPSDMVNLIPRCSNGVDKV